MPTKENGSGGQQEYDSSTGKFGGQSESADSKAFSSFGKSQSTPFKDWRAKAIPIYSKKHWDSPIDLVNPNGMSEEDYSKIRKGLPFLSDEQLAETPDAIARQVLGGKDFSAEGYAKEKEGLFVAYKSKKEEEADSIKHAFEMRAQVREDFTKAALKAGISDKKAPKICEAANKFNDLIEKAQKTLEQAGPMGEGGYIEGKSHRAWQAQSEGKMPASIAAKILGVSAEAVKANFEKTEWHHTGGDMFNETDFYDLSPITGIMQGMGRQGKQGRLRHSQNFIQITRYNNRVRIKKCHSWDW